MVPLTVSIRAHSIFKCLLCYSQQWILDKQDLVRERQLDLQILSEEEYQKIGIFFSNCKLQHKLQIVKPIVVLLYNKLLIITIRLIINYFYL